MRYEGQSHSSKNGGGRLCRGRQVALLRVENRERVSGAYKHFICTGKTCASTMAIATRVILYICTCTIPQSARLRRHVDERLVQASWPLSAHCFFHLSRIYRQSLCAIAATRRGVERCRAEGSCQTEIS